MPTKLERDYQAGLKKRIEKLLPGCKIFKQDELQQQGIPDLLILHYDKWAMLEVKASATAKRQPNQEYWVAHYGEMAFCAFIYPENEEEVLHALQEALQPQRHSRLSKR